MPTKNEEGQKSQKLHLDFILPPIISVHLTFCSFPPAAEIFHHHHCLSRPLGAVTALGPWMALLFRDFCECGYGGLLDPGWVQQARLGTGTHLALMPLGCPAVRVRGATRPHPFKASPGKGPCWKPRLSSREGLFSLSPPTKARLICGGTEVQTPHYHPG